MMSFLLRMPNPSVIAQPIRLRISSQLLTPAQHANRFGGGVGPKLSSLSPGTAHSARARLSMPCLTIDEEAHHKDIGDVEG